MTIWKFAATAIVLWIIAMLCGCSAEYWTGRIEPENSIKLSRGAFGAYAEIKTTQNTQGDLVVKGLKYNPETKAFELQDLHVTYNGDSSGVIASDAARMQYVIAGQQTQVQYMQAIGQNLAMIISAGGDAMQGNIQALLGGITKTPNDPGQVDDAPDEPEGDQGDDA